MARSLVLLAILMTSWATPSQAQLPGSTNPADPASAIPDAAWHA